MKTKRLISVIALLCLTIPLFSAEAKSKNNYDKIIDMMYNTYSRERIEEETNTKDFASLDEMPEGVQKVWKNDIIPPLADNEDMARTFFPDGKVLSRDDLLRAQFSKTIFSVNQYKLLEGDTAQDYIDSLRFKGSGTYLVTLDGKPLGVIDGLVMEWNTAYEPTYSFAGYQAAEGMMTSYEQGTPSLSDQIIVKIGVGSFTVRNDSSIRIGAWNPEDGEEQFFDLESIARAKWLSEETVRLNPDALAPAGGGYPEAFRYLFGDKHDLYLAAYPPEAETAPLIPVLSASIVLLLTAAAVFFDIKRRKTITEF